MKTTIKKTLSLILCVLMVFSTATTSFAAEGTINAFADEKYFQNASEAENADAILDIADKFLGSLSAPSGTLKKVLDAAGKIGLTVDYRSINGIAQTIDTASKVDGMFGLCGDLKDFNFGVWKRKMSRPKNDVDIIYELIELIGTTERSGLLIKADKTNPEIIAKAVKGNIDLGIIEDYFTLSEITGPDGFYGLIKGLLIEMCYAENSAQYKAAYSKTLDSFIYEDLLPAKLSGYLPGFKMDNSSKIDTLLTAVLYSCWSKYIVPAIKSVNDSWARDEKGNVKENLKDLLSVVNFNGSSFDASSITVDASEPFAKQINNLLGAVAKFFVSDCTWENGDYTKISKNLNNLILFVAKKLGITTSSVSSEAVALEIVKYIFARIESNSVNEYVNGINNCKTMKEAAVIVLKNTAKAQNIKITDKADATYENILGDFAVSIFGKFIDMDYESGEGKNVWDVLNDIVNIFLFDKGCAKALNLNVKKNDSLFTKLDAIISMTGIFADLKPQENYKTEAYLKALIDAVFALDIETIVDLTVVRFIGDFGQKNAMETVYKAVASTLKSYFSRDILTSYKNSNPLDNAIQNNNLSETVKNLLIALNSRKKDIIPPILYLANVLINPEIKAESVSASDAVYTGQPVYPDSLKVKVGGKTFTLKNGVDYTLTTESKTFNIGDTVSANVNLTGFVEGTATVSYKIVLGNVSSVKASDITPTSAVLSWDKVSGADKYEISLSGKTVATTADTSFKLSSIPSGANLSYSVAAVKGNSKSAAATVKFSTPPQKVNDLKATGVSAATVGISWAAAAGATSYTVSYTADGKAWKTVTAASTQATLKSLSANTAYQIKVKAFSKNSNAYGEESSPITVITAPAKANGITLSSFNANSAVISFAPVSGATSYTVSYSADGKNWNTVVTNSTSATLPSLSANTTYQVKVKAFSQSANTYGEDSAVFKFTTAPTKTEGLRATSVSASSISIAWTPTAGATSYTVSYTADGKTWNTITVSSPSVTLQSLSANTSYKISVKAFSKNSNAYGEDSSPIGVITAISKTTALKAKKTTANSITLSFNAVDGATEYIVSYSTDGKKWKTQTTTSNSVTLKSLSSGTVYQLKVKAFNKNSGLYGEESSILKVTTNPAKVTKLKATKTTSTTVTLSWNKTNGATGYVVAYSTNGKKWKTVKASKNSVTVKKLKSNKKYYFKVKAVKGSLSGEYSSKLTASTRVAAVKGLKAKSKTKTSITLSWNKVSGATGYEVWQLVGKKWKKVGTIKKGKTTTYKVKKLKKNKTYKFKVRAVKNKKAGNYSSVLKVKTAK